MNNYSSGSDPITTTIVWGILLLLYFYFAISLVVIAKKTNTPKSWLGWIPIANAFLMIQIAKKPLWWFLLFLVPLVNIIIGATIWTIIAEKVGKPYWVGLLIIIPVINLFIPGYLAFTDSPPIQPTSVTTTAPLPPPQL